jgi:hypothetical protein
MLMMGPPLLYPIPRQIRPYPPQSAQKPGLGFSVVSVVGVICLSSGALSNASLGRYSAKVKRTDTTARDVGDAEILS